MSLTGFIGLGNMGGHMARNLLKNGKKLIVYDVNKQVVDQFKSEGCEVATHPADIAAASKEIVTVLPSSPHVKAVYQGENGIFKTIQPGTLCMDSSTIDQVVTLEVAQAAALLKAEYIDAPISGGVTGAQQATLTFMVGAGNDETFARANAVLSLMGKNIVNLGAVGNGTAAKICNNMLLGIQMVAVAETMNLGMSMGLDAKALAGIINTSSGRCWSSDTYNPVPGVLPNIPCAKLLSFLDNLQSTLRTSGFNEQSVSEVMQAMQVLAKYNIMGLGLGLGVAAMAQMRTGQESQMTANHGSAGFGDGYGGGVQGGGQGGGGQGGQGGPQGDQSYWRR